MTWLTDKPDRACLVTWLAIRHVAGRGGAFAERMLAALVDCGELTPAQEAAVRRAKARVEQRAVRLDPSRGGRHDGYRRGNADYRVGAA